MRPPFPLPPAKRSAPTVRTLLVHCIQGSRRKRNETLSVFGSRLSGGGGGGAHHTQRELINIQSFPGRALPKHRRVPFPDHQVLHSCPWEVHILAGGEAGGQQAAEAQQHRGQPLVGATSALDQEHHVHACAKAALRLSAPPRAPQGRQAGGRASRREATSFLGLGKPCVRLSSSLFPPPALPCFAFPPLSLPASGACLVSGVSHTI